MANFFFAHFISLSHTEVLGRTRPAERCQLQSAFGRTVLQYAASLPYSATVLQWHSGPPQRHSATVSPKITLSARNYLTVSQ